MQGAEAGRRFATPGGPSEPRPGRAGAPEDARGTEGRGRLSLPLPGGVT